MKYSLCNKNEKISCLGINNMSTGMGRAVIINPKKIIEKAKSNGIKIVFIDPKGEYENIKRNIYNIS